MMRVSIMGNLRRAHPKTPWVGDAGGEAPAGRPFDIAREVVVAYDIAKAARSEDGRRGPAGGRTRDWYLAKTKLDGYGMIRTIYSCPVA